MAISCLTFLKNLKDGNSVNVEGCTISLPSLGGGHSGKDLLPFLEAALPATDDDVAPVQVSPASSQERLWHLALSDRIITICCRQREAGDTLSVDITTSVFPLRRLTKAELTNSIPGNRATFVVTFDGDDPIAIPSSESLPPAAVRAFAKMVFQGAVR